MKPRLLTGVVKWEARAEEETPASEVIFSALTVWKIAEPPIENHAATAR